MLPPRTFAGLALSSLVVALPASAHDDGLGRCGLLDPALVAEAPPVPTRAGELTIDLGGAPRVRTDPHGPPRLHAQGALSGKTVYLSAGHGWTWLEGAWRTQRPTTNALIEGLVSAETTSQYLIPYLRNMGAYVVPVRDPDFQTELVIVDDDAAVVEGSLDELTSSASGWGEVALPISGHTNPFDAGGTRLFAAAASETGRLVYAATIPKSGHYGVYVSYVQAPDRASDAHYVVAHAGGESHYQVDQRRHGMTWVMLGRHWFEAGAPPEMASVTLVNDSDDPGAFLSTDAVRFGAGSGRVDRGGGPNDRPMWENNCRYHAQLSGAPPQIYDAISDDFRDDVAARSRFADWDHEPGEDAVYVAWHTNAPNPLRGTESFTYSPFGDNGFGSQSDFTGVPGSIQLQNAVHDRLIDDIRSLWDPTWPNRGKYTAYFGEVNPANNDEMPAVLLEIAFHDTPADADALREPRFRQITARAIARGIAAYFAEKDGVALVLPPEPPIALAVSNDGEGGLMITWRPPVDFDGPISGYRVYLSEGGHGFDDGRDVTTESLTLSDLDAGEVRYVRVAAVNEGGESLPTEVVGARVASSGAAPVLVVGAFDRLDAGMMPVEDLSQHGMAAAQRMRLDQMNDGSYAARHGAAIAGAGYSFDGASDEAIDAGDLDLTRYVAIDWFAGETSTGDDPFSAPQREAITSYLAAGGRAFVSGSELGWALDLYGSTEEQAFYRDVLATHYAEDDSETYGVSPVEGPYAALAPFRFDDDGPGSYDADYPDVFSPAPGALAALAYDGGLGGVAAITWQGDDGAAVINFGFPFETIAGAATRIEVMRSTLAFFGVEEEPASGGGGNGSGVGGGSGSGGAGGAWAYPAETERASCACRLGHPPSPARLAWLALPLLGAFARARRSRGRGSPQR